MNAKRLIFGAAVAMAAMAQAADTRTGVIDGDATLQGPLFKTFRRMFRNHVLAQEPSYLVECYRNRTETSQWQSEFWGKYMHSAEPFCTMMKDAGLRAKIDESVAKLIKEQQPDGYLGNYAPSRRSAKRAWDVWGIKYTMLGLLHHYDSTGSKESLGACRRLCDYLIARNGPGAETTIGRTGNYSGMPSCSTL